MIVAVGIATYNEFLFDQPGVYRQPVQGQEEFVYSWWLPSASMTNTPVGSQRASIHILMCMLAKNICIIKGPNKLSQVLILNDYQTIYCQQSL